MKKTMGRWVLGLAVASLTFGVLAPAGGVAGQAGQPIPVVNELAVADQLKAQAFEAVRAGKFEETQKLLSKAATVSRDPALTRMAEWAQEFEAQRAVFTSERRQEFEKVVGEVKLLQSRGHHDYAADSATRAYLLADDKKAFRADPWIETLVQTSVDLGKQFEKQEQWLKALRVYSDLASLDPSKPEWKEKIKLMTRRVRLMALYTPDDLKTLQKEESKLRKEVEALLKSATRPSEKPDVAEATTRAAAEEANEDSFRLEWREQLQDIKLDMLKVSLAQARENYYRQVDYVDLARGGLKGLEALATTKGLEKAFPGLADEKARAKFMEVLTDCQAKARAAAAGQREQTTMMRDVLERVEKTNEATVKLPDVVWVSEFADGAFAELDPFSSVIWPTEMAEFRRSTEGEFSGVGIQIQSDEEGSLKVASPLEDSPAFKKGIKAGDIITHIDGKKAQGIPLTRAVKAITGRPGTPVKLTVKSPDGRVVEHTIIREQIKVASVKGWRHKPGGGWEYFVDPDQKIGYVRLTNFSKTTGEELDKATREMQAAGAKALIIDLRYNPGGLLQEAVKVCDKFIREGTIVSTKPDRPTQNRPSETKASGDGDELSIPTIVLINQYSASASEIVSGALKDHKRATLVGERTFGKGSVQMLYPLLREGMQPTSALKLTTSHYYLPSNVCIHREENSTTWGVDPDVVVEMTPEQMRAAIDARAELDVLRDVNSPPAEAAQPKLEDKSKGVAEAVAKVKKDPLASDPQLGAALLLLRLQINGGQM